MSQPVASPPDLPDGLSMVGGKVMFTCLSCGGTTEWPAEIEDFDPDNPSNVCGGSPRCIP